MSQPIIIEPARRSYRVQFPYKPCDSAIPGFHQAGMVWQKNGSGLDVYWAIPVNKLADAKEIIDYWFTESPKGDGLNRQGKACCGVLVAEAEELRRVA